MKSKKEELEEQLIALENEEQEKLRRENREFYNKFKDCKYLLYVVSRDNTYRSYSLLRVTDVLLHENNNHHPAYVKGRGIVLSLQDSFGNKSFNSHNIEGMSITKDFEEGYMSLTELKYNNLLKQYNGIVETYTMQFNNFTSEL